MATHFSLLSSSKQLAQVLFLSSLASSLLLLAAPSMSHYLNQTSKAVLDKYKGDLDNLRQEAKHDPAKERELVKEFKVNSPCKTPNGYIYTLSSLLDILVSSLNFSVRMHVVIHV